MDTFAAKVKYRYFFNPTGDLTGGLMAAIVALPLSLAFGAASGLGAAAGLYGAIACGIFAALLGGTRGLCSGPTGPMTVVTAGMFAANPGQPEIVFAAIFLGGLLQIVLGNLKAGQLIQYLPYPVISGFMIGIGTIIICIQIHPLLGLKGSGSALASIQSLPAGLANINTDAVLIGCTTVALIYLTPLISRKLPAVLIALTAATAMSLTMHMDVPRIGEISAGLPVPRLPHFDLTHTNIVLQGAMTLALLGMIDSLLTSLVLDRLRKERHNSDLELIGQGAGNMCSGLIGGLPGAGATMNSLVNIRAGGKSHLSGAVQGLVLLGILLGGRHLAALIPLSGLAGILMTVGINIMDWRALKSIRQAPRSDVAVMIVVLLLTVFVDLIIAVGIGIAMASVLFAKRLADAGGCAVSTLDSLEEFHKTAQDLPENIRKAIYTYDFHGPLFFGEAKNLSAAVDQLLEARYIILRFYNVPLADQSGAYALEDAVERWEAKGSKVLFVGLQPHIRQVLENTGAIHKIDIENCFDQFEDAIEAIVAFAKHASVAESGRIGDVTAL